VVSRVPAAGRRAARRPSARTPLACHTAFIADRQPAVGLVAVIVFIVGAVITHLRVGDYSLAPATVFLLLAVATLVLGLAS